jgi:serine protease AprX
MTRFGHRGLVPVLLAGIGAPGSYDAAGVGDRSEPALSPELRQAIIDSGPETLLPVVILPAGDGDVLPSPAALALGSEGRRRETIDRLKARAEATQTGLVAELHRLQTAGEVGARIRGLWIVNAIAVDASPAALEELARRGDVARIVLNHRQALPLPAPGAERAAMDVDCGIERMGAPRVWNELGITGRGAVVAVIDTGTCYRHADLANRIWHNDGEVPDNGIDDDANGYIDDVMGWNFREGTNDPDDYLGHGTHVAGTVAGDGTGGSRTGMAPGSSLMLLCINTSFADEAQVWEAMQYAVENGAHSWNLSLGWPHRQNPMRALWRDVCRNAIAAGLTPVVSAGSDGACCRPYDAVWTPGDVPEVVTVGITDCTDVLASMSSRGPVTWQDVSPYNDWPHPPGKLKPTVSAPGINTLSTRMCSGYSFMSGASMSVPHVAGTVALMVEANGDLTPEETKQILVETSIDGGAPGWDNDYGAGRADAYEAVREALDWRDRVSPTALRVTRGDLSRGSPESLRYADDDEVIVEARAQTEVAAASVEIEVEGALPTDNPPAFTVHVRAACGGAPALQRVELYNFRGGFWESVDERAAPRTDEWLTLRFDDDPRRFVEGGTGRVRARIGFHDRGVTFPGWSGRFDVALWVPRP